MTDHRAEVVDRVRRRLAGESIAVDQTRIATLLRAETRGLIGDRELLELIKTTEAEISGVGPLESLLRDPAVTDVLVNGPHDVWIDSGNGLVPTDVDLGSAQEVQVLAQRLAARAGRRLDEATPWVDASLPDGTRLHAVIPPVAADCALISIRTLRQRRMSLESLVHSNFMSTQVAELVSAIVQSRLSFLISGGTGSGKTTLLSVLLGTVRDDERVLIVEDADELRPEHPQTVKLLSRPPNIEGVGEITLRSLVRQALRMRPDRIVVGEVRGAEVAELLMALNTGHRGGAGTIHANGVADVPARLAALGAVAGLSLDALAAQTLSAIDVLMHVRRRSDGTRVLTEIAVLESVDGRPVAQKAWARDAGPGPGAERLERLLVEATS